MRWRRFFPNRAKTWVRDILVSAGCGVALWLLRPGAEVVTDSMWVVGSLVLVAGVWFVTHVLSEVIRDKRPTDLERRATILAVWGVIVGAFFMGRRGGGNVLNAMPIAQAQDLAGPYVINRRFRVADLVSSLNPFVEKKRFEKCFLEGPAVITLCGDSLMNGSSWIPSPRQHSAEDMIWVVEKNTCDLVGAVQFIDCEFVNCHFALVTLVGPAEMKRKWLESISKGEGA